MAKEMKCSRCGEIKSIDDFHKRRDRPSGRASHCKECDRKRGQEYRKKHQTKFAKNRRIWIEQNPEKLMVYKLKYREKNAEKIRAYEQAYRKDNASKIRARELIYNAANPEKRKAKQAVRHAVNKGILVKPKYCECCGKKGLLHGHHEDYSKQLDVMWLCPSCHYHVANE